MTKFQSIMPTWRDTEKQLDGEINKSKPDFQAFSLVTERKRPVKQNNRRSMSYAFSRRFQLHFLSPLFLHALYFLVHIVFFLLATFHLLRFFFLATLSLFTLFFFQRFDGVRVNLKPNLKIWIFPCINTSFFFFDTVSAWSLGAKRSNCCNFFSFFGLSLFAPSAAQPPPREGLLSRDREVLE